jgi:pimeloyl-ACP methyl ester carboxylesterase
MVLSANGGLTMNKRTLAVLAAVSAAGVAYVISKRSPLRPELYWESIEKPGRIVDVDGYGVHCLELGSGPAIVLVHGFGGSTYSYRRLAPILAERHRTIAVDLKGFGYSQRDSHTGLSHTDQVTMLRGLLRELGVSSAVFVGHSMGGAVVQRFAATYPDMVDALVLAASVTGDERYRRAVPPPVIVKPMAAIIAALVSRRLLELSFYDPAHLTDELRDAYLRPIRIRGTIDGILRSGREAAGDPAFDRSRITMPTLLLYAAHDRVVPLKTAQHLRTLLPHARLVVVDKAAHLLLEEQPEVCAGAIEDFLREALRPGATAVARRDA